MEEQTATPEYVLQIINVRVSGWNSGQSVEAHIYPSGLATHIDVGDRVDGYTLTHVETGLAILTHVSETKIAMLAREAGKLCNWSQITMMSPDEKRNIYQQVLWLLHNEKTTE
jgi:hypothetical protein